jgi:hypothetical protein
MVADSRFFLGAVLVGIAASLVPAARAQALGGEFSKDYYFRALTTGPESSKEEAVAALRGFPDEPRVAEVVLEALKKTPTGGAFRDSILGMIMLLPNYPDQPGVIDTLMKLLESSNYKVVMAAADALGEIGDVKALDKLLKLTSSAQYGRLYGFRKCVMQALMRIQDPRVVELMLRELPKLEGQLEFDVVRYLSHISLQRVATDAEKWNTWWKDNAEDFHFTENAESFSLGADVPDDFVWDKEVPQFFGTYIHAKKLIFVLDISNSMKNNVEGGTSRLERAKQELIQSIEQLSDDTRFTIVAFHGKIVVWNRRLVPAGDPMKEKATEWVTGLTMAGGTASYDALDRGFAVDGNTEAIFFLSDGRPVKGTIADPVVIVEVLGRENFFRRIALYTFGVGVGRTDQHGGAAWFMRSLAEQNSGVYIGVN